MKMEPDKTVRHPFNGRIQVIKGFVSDHSGYLGPTPGEFHLFMGDK
jgi:hypothetical protein